MKKILSGLFTGTCVWFTVLSVIFIVIRAIASGIDGAILEVSSFLLLLPCGLLLSSAGLIYRHSPLATWLRFLLHWLLTLTAFFCFLWLPSGDRSGVKNLLAIAFFTLAYVIVFVIVYFTRQRIKNIKEED